MINSIHTGKETVLEYTDPVEGFRGWLVMDSPTHRLCAGGLRIQKGLTRECVTRLARNMTMKMRIAGIRADGAKSGIDYDPHAPGREKALERFFHAIMPVVLERYSMGPDLNTTMPELNGIAARFGIPSVKIAVARAQEFDDSEFLERISVLSMPAGLATLDRLRSGSGLAAACLGALDFLGIPYSEAEVALQGFGGLGAGAAWFLEQAGVKVVAIADREKSLLANGSGALPVESLIQNSSDGLIPVNGYEGQYQSREKINDVPCDLFVPAAMEKTVTEKEAGSMNARAVVCGANLAVIPEAENILYERGILLVPDMIAGCGGSLSMDGLFGPPSTPSVQDVLDSVKKKMRDIVWKVLERSQKAGISSRQAAMQLCRETPLLPDAKPYGSLNGGS